MWHPASGDPVWDVSLLEEALCRSGLSGGRNFKGAGRICGCLHAAGVVERTFACSTAVEGSPKIGRTSIESAGFSCASLNPPHAPKAW